jgi:hypothetical protein
VSDPNDKPRRIKTQTFSRFEPPEVTYETVPDPDEQGLQEWEDEQEDRS